MPNPITARNTGWASQFRFAVHGFWSGVWEFHRSAMKWIAAISLSTAIFGCASSTQTGSAVRFSVTPFGDRTKATRIDAQKGDHILNPITSSDFEEVTIAQGSGLNGFDAVRVYHNGSGYIVFSERRDKNRRIAINLTPGEMSGLFQALNRDKIALIDGLYSTEFNDGAQGFIEIKTSGGRRYCWLDNHFDPVMNTFNFCNRVILPKIGGARTGKRGIGRQEEYDRVFPRKAAPAHGEQRLTRPKFK